MTFKRHLKRAFPLLSSLALKSPRSAFAGTRTRFGLAAAEIMRSHLGIGWLVRPTHWNIGGASIFAFARKSPRFRLDIALARQRIAGDRELDRLQAFQFVAKAGGLLEVEIGGGGVHPFFEIGDRRLEIMSGENFRRAKSGIGGDMVLLIDRAQNVRDPAFDRGRRNPVGAVKGPLLFPPAGCLGPRTRDRPRLAIGIEDHLAIDIAGCAANRLNKRRFAAQKSF